MREGNGVCGPSVCGRGPQGCRGSDARWRVRRAATQKQCKMETQNRSDASADKRRRNGGTLVARNPVPRPSPPKLALLASAAVPLVPEAWLSCAACACIAAFARIASSMRPCCRLAALVDAWLDLASFELRSDARWSASSPREELASAAWAHPIRNISAAASTARCARAIVVARVRVQSGPQRCLKAQQWRETCSNNPTNV